MIQHSVKPSYEPIDFDRLEIHRVYEWLTNRSADTNKLGRTARLVLCPAADHLESDPSCKLTAGDNVWYCYGCKLGGKIIEMIIAAGAHAAFKTGGVDDRVAAIRWLRGQLGIAHAPPTTEQPISQRSSRAGHRLQDEYVSAIHRYENADGSLAYAIPRIYGTRNDGSVDKRFEYYRPTPLVPFTRERTIEERHFVDRHGKRLYTLVVIGGSTRDKRGVRYELIATARTPYLPRHIEIKPGGHPQLIYRLPEVLRAAAAGAVIYAPEGENKADTLAKLGLPATSVPFGGNAKLDPAWRAHFAGARMLVVPADADGVGRSTALSRADFLSGAAAATVAIDPFPDRVDGYDVTNFVDDLTNAGHDLSTIRTIVEECFRKALLTKGLDLP